MTAKELITKLLEYDMDSEVVVTHQGKLHDVVGIGFRHNGQGRECKVILEAEIDDGRE
jgi:hypothetical protein